MMGGRQLIWLAVFGPLLLTGCPPKYPYGDGRGITGQLEREVIALQQRNRLLEEQVATCSTGGPPDPLYSELVQVFSGSEIELTRQGNITSLVIPGNHLFAADRHEIRYEAAKTLDLLGMALSSHPKHTILIEGHVSDRTLTRELRRDHHDDWDLSTARAKLVMWDLVNKYRVSEDRFTVAGRAQFDPLASNDTSAGQGVNERVVLYIYPPGAR